MCLKDNQWSVSSLFIYFIPQSYSSERWTWAIFVTRFHTKHPQVEIINKAPLPKDSSHLALSPPLELFLISVPQAQHRGCNLLPCPPCLLRKATVCLHPVPSTYLSLPLSFSFFMSTMPPVVIWKGSSCRKHTT